MEPIVLSSGSDGTEQVFQQSAPSPLTNEHQHLLQMRQLSLPQTAFLTFNAGDFSEAFRLYIGTNVTLFPYIMLLGGTYGGIVISFGVVFLLFLSVQHMDRSKLLALATARDECTSGDPEERRFQAHQAVRTYVDVARSLFTPTNGPSVRDSASKKRPPDPASVQFISAIIYFSQFCSACAFVMMLGIYIATLLGFRSAVGLLLSSLVFVFLLASYNPKTAVYFANVNNTTLIGASVIILFAMATQRSAASTAPSSAAPLWMWPRTAADAWIAVCIAISYISCILYVPDSETNIADRYLERLNFPIGTATRARSNHLMRRFEALVVLSSIVAV